MVQINKKLNTVENNVNNKYKILKEKLANNNSNNKINNNYINLISQEKKEKIANLEIKIKFLEDSINKYKEKNQENEQKIYRHCGTRRRKHRISVPDAALPRRNDKCRVYCKKQRSQYVYDSYSRPADYQTHAGEKFDIRSAYASRFEDQHAQQQDCQ